MKLVASAIVRNEVGRYLAPWVDHLLEFVDEVRLIDDASTDDTYDYLLGRLAGDPRGFAISDAETAFYRHEGQARQRLLDWTLTGNPTHVLAIDADEFVTDGAAVRRACEAGTMPGAWHLCMQEVWGATEEGLRIRQDGGWEEHDVPILWAPAALAGRKLEMKDVALACGRTPTALNGVPREHTCSAILHFGWAQPAERAARHQRYVEHDGGRFHHKPHLDSIIWPDERCKLSPLGWPPALARWKDEILEHAGPRT